MAKSRLVIGVIGSFILAIFYASAGIYISSVSDAPCAFQNESATYELPKYCSEINLYMKGIVYTDSKFLCHKGTKPLNECSKAFYALTRFGYINIYVCLQHNVFWCVRSRFENGF